MNIVLPNILVSFDDLNVDLEEAAWAYLQPPAREALAAAIQERGVRLSVNSAYRTIAQQLLLYRWGKGCGYKLVAPPGKSNHQSGLAIDIDDHDGWCPYLERHGWKWLGNQDPPHFDYVGGETRDIRGTAMLAFQKLWNKNNPNDRIAEDGGYGAQTESRLNQAVAGGFNIAPWDEQPRVLRLCRPIMQGSDVSRLQESLKAAGYAVEADGFFGAKTAELVKQFQTEKSLTVDGIVGSVTFGKLKESIA
jgi:N-acetylmuramoyl-L-alanine amidase